MKFGCHISSRDPFSESVIRAKLAGCEAMQIFANPPQRWNPISIPDSEIKNFNKLNAKANINPVVIHGIYLINLASDNPFFYQASIKSLIDDMKKAKEIGALGVNFHVGSTKGKKLEEVLTKVVLAIKDILAAVPEGPYLIIENSAGAGSVIGDEFKEIGAIINAVKSDRLKVTLDTAHSFESGYDISTATGIDQTIDEFDKEIGLEKLVCLHLNDSATPLKSAHDRHADIGQGHIGIEGFRRIVNHPHLKDLPGILETPSLKGKGDIDNLKILRSLVDK